jgi:very-short-patch-repair endonuclease
MTREPSPSEQLRRAEAAARRTRLEDAFALQVKALRLPVPDREFVFHPTRRWRFDFAWPEFKVAAEIDGGQWSNGRHVRGYGFEGDAEKLNAAQELGWRVFRYTARQVLGGVASMDISNQLERASWARRPE